MSKIHLIKHVLRLKNSDLSFRRINVYLTSKIALKRKISGIYSEVENEDSN